MASVFKHQNHALEVWFIRKEFELQWSIASKSKQQDRKSHEQQRYSHANPEMAAVEVLVDVVPHGQHAVMHMMTSMFHCSVTMHLLTSFYSIRFMKTGIVGIFLPLLRDREAVAASGARFWKPEVLVMVLASGGGWSSDPACGQALGIRHIACEGAH